MEEGKGRGNCQVGVTEEEMLGLGATWAVGGMDGSCYNKHWLPSDSAVPTVSEARRNARKGGEGHWAGVEGQK
jgi:hypothetical protein